MRLFGLKRPVAVGGPENGSGHVAATATDPVSAHAAARATSIIATLREAFVVLDDELRVEMANRSFYETFQVAAGETEGRPLYELGNGQWDKPPPARAPA
jgi:PAS domain-containing protein